MKPLYYVGEEVILCEDGNTYIVDEIVSPGQTFFDRVVKYRRNSSHDQGYGYLLNVSFKTKTKHEGECLWAERMLKKKHKPSEKSFDQLISEIKCPRSITQ